MQDTAEGFGQPIRQIFEPFFQMERELPTPFDTKPTYRVTVHDRFWRWLYVPATCAAGNACRLHVALHGCKQGQSYLPLTPPPGGGLYNGTTFVKNTGYDRWADNNHLVILYPQALTVPGNPNGCWDWWGYTGQDYATREGVQIRTLRAMVDALAGQ